MSLTQLPILQTWDEKREWNGRLQVEQDLCFTDHEHHDKKTTIEKKNANESATQWKTTWLSSLVFSTILHGQ